MSIYEMKDSGRRQEFPTGARRDLQEGKGRPDLISTVFLQRLAVVMELGAGKYGDRNWEKGMPLSRYYSSALRHLMQAFEGRTDEDHLGQAAFNVMAFMHTQEMVKRGLLDPSLDDLPHLENQEACIAAWVADTAVQALEGGPSMFAADPPFQSPEEVHQEAQKILQREMLEGEGLVECLDGVWRPAASKDASVKNPGEVQTPIYARDSVAEAARAAEFEHRHSDPFEVRPTMDAIRESYRIDAEYPETGELTDKALETRRGVGGGALLPGLPD